MKKNIGDLKVTKEEIGKISKLVCEKKETYLMTNAALARKNVEVFGKKSNGKSGHSTIHFGEDNSLSSAKDWSKMDPFSGERNPDQK